MLSDTHAKHEHLIKPNPINAMAINEHADPSYKRLFSHPEMVRDLIQGFIHKPWVEDLQFDTLERYPTEFITDRLKRRHSDVIWRVRWGSQWLYLYLLLEFQSSVQRFMALRISHYLDLLYQDLVRGRHFVGRPRQLPPVVPIVIYNGDKPWTAPTELDVLIAPGPDSLTAYRPQARYLLIAEHAYADADLAGMHNLAAALFRLENSRTPATVRDVLQALIDWLAEPGMSELRRTFVIWLREAFLRSRLPNTHFPEVNELDEVQSMLSERIVDWTKQWKEEGLQEGRQEGVHSQRRLLLGQLQRRFGESTATRSQPLLEQIEDFAVLEALGLELFDCPDEASWLVKLEQAGHV